MLIGFISWLRYLPGHSGRMPGKLAKQSRLNLVRESFFQKCLSSIDPAQTADFT
jgi:hypothetical protein